MSYLFDDMFDLDNDGEIDDFERALEIEIMDEMDSDDDDDDSWDDDDELIEAGLDRDELEFMDEDERREALEDAGLDPDDYDFD